MARDLDGTDDVIDFGSDASIDNWTQKSMLVWLQHDVAAADFILNKGVAGPGNTGFFCQILVGNTLQLQQSYFTSSGSWVTTATISTSARHQAGFSLDKSSDTNNPELFIDGVSQSVTESTSPSGTPGDDSVDNLELGQNNGGTADFDGKLAFFVMVDFLVTAADVNRHRWWGMCPGGPSTMKIWQPMWSGDLTNKGTATANGTPAGTTVTNLPVLGVGRPGMGIGL